MPTIKQEMAAIDRRNFDWYENLSDDERKSLSMWVLMRYCSSTSSNISDINEHYLTMTNELVNVNFNDLRHHPELQMRLMQCVGIGSDQFHPWINPMKRKKSKKGNAKLESFLLELYPTLKDDEMSLLIETLGDDKIRDMLEDAGIEKKKIREYIK